MNIKCIQWLHSFLVQPGATQNFDGPTPFSWRSDVFPFTVPAGWWLGITSMQLGSKLTDGSPGAGGISPRASYLIIPNVMTLPDNVTLPPFPAPIMIPPGTTITAQIINNDADQQWFTSVITGLLIESAETDYRKVYAPVIEKMFAAQGAVNVTIPPIEIPPVSVSIPPMTFSGAIIPQE